jgi:hypothetical protein
LVVCCVSLNIPMCKSQATTMFPVDFGGIKLKHVVTKVRNVDGSVVLVDGDTETRTNRENTIIEAATDETIGFVMPTVGICAHDAVLNRDVLYRNKVTHILNVAFGANAFPDEFLYKTVSLLDTDAEPLTEVVLNECLGFIDDAIDNPSNVNVIVVHCNMGVSRSAAILMAWLIVRFGLVCVVNFTLTLLITHDQNKYQKTYVLQ